MLNKITGASLDLLNVLILIKPCIQEEGMEDMIITHIFYFHFACERVRVSLYLYLLVESLTMKFDLCICIWLSALGSDLQEGLPWSVCVCVCKFV